jgi:predicted Holliday junction resolvase-like endonuclease
MELSTLLLAAAIIVIVVLIYLYASLKAQIPALVQKQSGEWQIRAESELQKRVNLQFQEWREKELRVVKAEAQREIETFKAEIHKEAVTHAQNLYQSWCENQTEFIKKEQREIALKEAETYLARWLHDNEKSIRQDAIQKSQAVTVGKVTEHLVPYLPDFVYNPKDARFIGSPVDFIIFDGLSSNDGEVEEVVFVEIKTGKSSLSPRERQVKKAIQDCKVRWLELRVNHELQSPKLF